MLDTPLVKKLIQLAIEEDLGLGDPTSDLTLRTGQMGRARIKARQELVVCGTPLIELIFRELTWSVSCAVKVTEGQRVNSGTELAVLEGEMRHLLMAERTILNFLQRLSGIATNTRKYVDAVPELSVLDTRKTTPGWRILEKYAVQTGGGKNHRFSLGDMILVKNNHIDANSGSVEDTLQRVYSKKPEYLPVEVEVRTIDELKSALGYRPDVVMLDNMNDQQVSEALRVITAAGSQTKVEVSGGVTLERLRQLAKLGVTRVSLSALTGQAATVDVSMAIELRK